MYSLYFFLIFAKKVIMPKKIVLFNHKGGVSKTTTVFHLGWMLTNLGNKVLLVDGDPQCNLSSVILGDRFDAYYEDSPTNKQNLKDGVSMVFDGIPTPIEAIDCPTSSRNKNLFLLPGHMNLSEYDAQLNFAQTATSALSSLKSLPGAFNDLIDKTAKKYNVDYVLIDLNPGLSAINQNLFLISDAFIIPTNPDTFSLMAIKSLSHILPKWVGWKTANISAFSDSAYPLPEDTPKFLGEIAQRFNIRNGKATRPYQEKIAALGDLTIELLIPSFYKSGMLLPDYKYQQTKLAERKYCLEEIKDFQGLSPKSHEANVPVYELTDRELQAQGAALEGMKENRQAFSDLYKSIAEQVVFLLS